MEALQQKYDELTKVMYASNENENTFTQLVRVKKMKDLLEEIESTTKEIAMQEMIEAWSTTVVADGFEVTKATRTTKKFKLDLNMVKIIAPEAVETIESVNMTKFESYIQLKGLKEEDYFDFKETEYLMVKEKKESKKKAK